MDATYLDTNTTMESLIEKNSVLFYVDALWLSLMSFAGVIGNSIALFAVATTPSLRTVTQFHITILAGVDLFITAVIIPCRIVTDYYSGKWPGNELACHLLAYTAIFFVGFSLQQLVFLAQVRFLRVTRSDAVYRKFTSKPVMIGQQVYAVVGSWLLTLTPLYSDFGSVGYSVKMHYCIFTGRNQQMLAVLSMVAALVMIPLYYGLTFLHVLAHRRRVGTWRGPNNGVTRPGNIDSKRPEDALSQPDTVETVTQQTDGVALAVIAAGNTNRTQGTITDDQCIVTDLTIKMPVNSSLPGAEVSVNRTVPPTMGTHRNPRIGPTKESVKITRNLLFIFCGYMCCWMPWCVLSLIEPYMDIPIPVYHVLINMVLTNSCINPYLYASMSRNYRNAFKRCMKFRCFFKR